MTGRGERRRARALFGGCAALLAAALGGCAVFSGGGGGAAHPAVPGFARVRVELLGGFAKDHPAGSPGKVALLVDATRSMARATSAGPSRVRAARAAARRFVETLSPGTPLELLVLGHERKATCGRLPSPYDGDRDALLGRLDALSARGDGSLSAALAHLDGPEQGGYDRVVAVTALDDGCGGDLCRAVSGLAARGVRLDLVLIGGAEVPPCVTEAAHGPADATPDVAHVASAVPFHVESAGADPAILVCGKTGGLPVQLAAGPAAVVVDLDPPLRVERSFVSDTRWVLQVLDFPGLDPPERQWRWLAEAPPSGGAPEAP